MRPIGRVLAATDHSAPARHAVDDAPCRIRKQMASQGDVLVVCEPRAA